MARNNSLARTYAAERATVSGSPTIGESFTARSSVAGRKRQRSRADLVAQGRGRQKFGVAGELPHHRPGVARPSELHLGATPSVPVRMTAVRMTLDYGDHERSEFVSATFTYLHGRGDGGHARAESCPPAMPDLGEIDLGGSFGRDIQYLHLVDTR